MPVRPVGQITGQPCLKEFSATRFFNQEGEPPCTIQTRLAYDKNPTIWPGSTTVTASPSSTNPSVSTSDDNRPAPSRGNLTASNPPSSRLRKVTRTYSRRASFFL